MASKRASKGRKPSLKGAGLGPFLVGGAAMLWATDALFRLPTVQSLNPVFIVAMEHLIALIFLTPWILITRRQVLTSLTPKQWMAAALIGVGGSAFATVFFTAAFRYVNPSVAILLQKMQPLLVVLLAFFILGERPAKGFFIWALVALMSATLLSFPDLDFSFLEGQMDLRSRGVAYALSAAALWALSTICGKILLRNVLPSVVTFWRFLFGWVALMLLVMVSSGGAQWSIAVQPEVAKALIYMALIPGLLAMIIYYLGLERTSASTATMMELLFPVSAVILNAIFLGMPLNPTQIAAGIVLLISVTAITRVSRV